VEPLPHILLAGIWVCCSNDSGFTFYVVFALFCATVDVVVVVVLVVAVIVVCCFWCCCLLLCCCCCVVVVVVVVVVFLQNCATDGMVKTRLEEKHEIFHDD